MREVPQTSKDAFNATTTLRETQAQTILRILHEARALYLTGEEISDRCELTYVQVMKHTRNLQRAGQIQSSCYTRKNRSGFSAEQFCWLSNKPGPIKKQPSLRGEPCEGVRELQDKVAGFEPIVKAARALCEFYRHKGWSSVGEESELIAALMETTK